MAPRNRSVSPKGAGRRYSLGCERCACNEHTSYPGHAEISLLAGENTVRESLGHLYTDVNVDAGEPSAPQTAFIAKESVGGAVHALVGALFFTGAAGAAGAIVATAGFFGTALLAAVAGVAAFAGISTMLAASVDERMVEQLRDQIDQGHLLLFVRTSDVKRKGKAVEILSKHSVFAPCVIELPNTEESDG
jgi:hypothetical protein